ncbi:hypothetical protein Ahy_B03g067430 isoform B [Arachis hypogaea]|uniref:Uncharacterized protein n=1 Tax=Arachis hypogaea TaxID=3818 RepID=A0A445A6S4_ARAHY|nr:hypothetical protein Ahy_B03g067430 isoform B [Arachis hypogaea]
MSNEQMSGKNTRPGPSAGPTRHRPAGGTEDGEGNYGSSLVPTNVEIDHDYDKPYEFESEAFNNPVSSEDEGKTSYDSFNEDAEYGEVEFKVDSRIMPYMHAVVAMYKIGLKPEDFVHQ